RVEVLLSRPPPMPIDPASPAADERPPAVLRRGPDQVIIDVTMSQPGYLVLTDTHYPGWQATVDGAPAEILVANHAFRAVHLAAGEHVVEFIYAPISFRWGAWITLGAILLLAGLVVATRWPTRGSRSGADRGKV
ncbi:MAG: YfhO family protein, partial [Anaerolineae bacterium]